MCQLCKKYGFVSLNDVVNELLIMNDDNGRKDFLKYTNAVKNVYRELNLLTLKEAVRLFLPIDKKDNSVSLPDNIIDFSTISVIDNGKVVPLFYNNEIEYKDVLDLAKNSNCACEQCKCDNDDCGHLYKYEVVKELVSMKMPNGTSQLFERVLTKRIDDDGSVVQEIKEPQLIYNENNEHTSTEIVTIIENLCKVDLKECGCIENSEKNKAALVSCGCSAVTEYATPDYCAKSADKYSYNISEDRSKLYFSSNFEFDKVLVRCYVQNDNKNISIPLIAKDAIMFGAEHRVLLFTNPGKSQFMEQEFLRAKEVMTRVMNRMTEEEFRKVVVPNRKTPSL